MLEFEIVIAHNSCFVSSGCEGAGAEAHPCGNVLQGSGQDTAGAGLRKPCLQELESRARVWGVGFVMDRTRLLLALRYENSAFQGPVR